MLLECFVSGPLGPLPMQNVTSADMGLKEGKYFYKCFLFMGLSGRPAPEYWNAINIFEIITNI